MQQGTATAPQRRQRSQSNKRQTLRGSSVKRSLSTDTMGRLVDPAGVDAILATIAGARQRAQAQQEAERQDCLRALPAGGCEYCFDSGYLFTTWRSADKQLCGCERGAQIKARRLVEIEQGLLDKAGLTPRTRRFTLGSYPDKRAKGYRAVKAYCEAFDGQQGLLILGPVGIGKTGLEVSAGRAILHSRVIAGDERYSLRFISYPDLLDELKAGFRDDSYTSTLARYKQCRLLLLDDVGSRDNLEDDAHAALSNWQLEQLFDIANYRYEHMLPSIVTSNLKPEELRRRVGNRTVDRWLDSCFTLDLSGEPNLRLEGGVK